ncbi:MAG: sodium-dependent transporter [Ruminococcus sp.]|jgi:NSS family neurotransmitter:Na+ symporter|nr:sodium-dependent transporter [Ruminococcus sp.]
MSDKNIQKRASFSGQIGFVLAAAGSAVGLGNVWRFPYLAARYGGGAFLIIYLICVMTFGFTLMITEIALGRKTGKSVIEAYYILNKKWRFLGILSSLVPVLILPYYTVIGGWIIKYTSAFLIGQGDRAATDGFFESFIQNPFQSIIWWILFSILTMLFIASGVEKGIEKASKIMMPVLLVLLIGITVYSLTLPGAFEGVKYYLMPRAAAFTPEAVLSAVGQMFYSMSLAMGIMVTYGSYMKKSENIEKSVRRIEIFDTGVAFLAGLLVVPAVFAFSGSTANMNAGPSLMFITLPKVFMSMGAVPGHIVAILFFILMLFAALTSSISIAETVVSIIGDKFGLSRKKSIFCTSVIIAVLGIFSALGYGVLSGIHPFGKDSFLDFFDFLTNSVIMPIVALLTCIFVGFIIKPKTLIDEVKRNDKFKAEKFYKIFVKFFAPVILAAILIFGLSGG